MNMNMTMSKRKRTRIRMTTLLAALGLAAAPVVAAAATRGEPASRPQATQQDQMKMKKKMTEKAMSAEVVNVDVQAGTLTVKRLDAEIGEPLPAEQYQAEKSGVRGDHLTLVVDSDTRITEEGGHVTTLAGLQPGQRVNIRYETTKDGKMHVTGVERTSAK
jgi:hypothetical protein